MINLLKQFTANLDSRRKHLDTIPPGAFQQFHLQFWDWIEAQPLGAAFIDGLKEDYGDESSKQVANIARQGGHWEGSLPDTHEGMLAMAWTLISQMREDGRDLSPLIAGARFTDTSKSDGSQNERKNTRQQAFLSVFVDPLLNRIRESVDRRTLLALILRRYTKRCQRFDLDRLNKIRKEGENRSQVEDHLSRHFYKYLFDQQITFAVEERTESGEPDLVAYDDEKNDFVIEVKVYKDGVGVKEIAEWFSQLHAYAKDYNAAHGFLLVYNTREEELDVDVGESYLNLPTVRFLNRRYSFVIVDIFPDYESASQRDKAHAKTITHGELIEHMQDK